MIKLKDAERTVELSPARRTPARKARPDPTRWRWRNWCRSGARARR